MNATKRIHNRHVKNHSSCTVEVFILKKPPFRLLHETNVKGKGREMSDVMTVKVPADPLFYRNTPPFFKPTIPFEPAFQPARFGSWYQNRGCVTMRLRAEDSNIYF